MAAGKGIISQNMLVLKSTTEPAIQSRYMTDRRVAPNGNAMLKYLHQDCGRTLALAAGIY